MDTVRLLAGQLSFEACCLAEAEAAPPEGDASRFPLGLLDPFACFGGGEAEVHRRSNGFFRRPDSLLRLPFSAVSEQETEGRSVLNQ